MKAEDWIKVEDRLPEEKYGVMGNRFSDEVLVCGFLYTPKGARTQFLNIARYHYRDKEWYSRDHEDIKGRVTHWHPIELPKEDVEDGKVEKENL